MLARGTSPLALGLLNADTELVRTSDMLSLLFASVCSCPLRVSAKHAKDPTSTTTMWIKILCQWTCYLLYIWSLVAPKILTGRDFS